jgi:RHS repeat-associated protein
MHTIGQPITRLAALESDLATDLCYYRARYYEPITGRFVSEDPGRFQASAVNFYTYVDNDAADWVDPTGLDKVEVCCRPLHKAKPLLMYWHHCYIKITGSDGPHTWGVLPNKNNPQAPKGTQIPQYDAPENSGGKCQDASCGNVCQQNVDKLRNGLNNSVAAGSCPSCGSSYHNWWWRFDGNNSNSFVYSMIQWAGMCPPKEPRAPGYHYYSPVPMQ